jgi:hypothetical protein
MASNQPIPTQNWYIILAKKQNGTNVDSAKRNLAFAITNSNGRALLLNTAPLAPNAARLASKDKNWQQEQQR